MRIETFSIVVGTKACDGHCPFCVAKMTGNKELPALDSINEANFHKACRLAEMRGTTTVLLTGKGEPSLYPKQVLGFLQLLQPKNFPFVEMQTNGLSLGYLARDGRSDAKGLDRDMVRQWQESGLNTLALSVVDTVDAQNALIYNSDYPELKRTIGFIHEFGFTVRLCVMMLHGFVDSPEKVEEVVRFCREEGVEQLTIRPIRQTKAKSQSDAAALYVEKNGLNKTQEKIISGWCVVNGTKLMTLPHGATIYDVHGQNLCLSDCLTVNGEDDNIRTLIFYPNGTLAYDWQYPGAILLGGRK
jgi:molybdenum cofactor biosynthesis enzyme MoaA